MWDFESLTARSSSPSDRAAVAEGPASSQATAASRGVDRLVRSGIRLPVLPHVAAAVIEVADSPRASADDLRNAISTDQALVAKLLRVVNSPMYSPRQPVTTVTHAIAFLGFESVRNLALAASFAEVLTSGASGYGLEPGQLWAHSVAVGCAAKLLSEAAKYPQPEEAFLAGVIHDVGKLVLSVNMEREYGGAFAQREPGERPFDEAERACLGFCHAEAGAAVASDWGLPALLCDAIRWHHSPEGNGGGLLTYLVHVGDAIGLVLGYGIGRDGLEYRFCRGAMQALGVGDQQLAELMAAVPPAVRRIAGGRA